MGEFPDFYHSLGVSPEANADEIRAAYRKLALDAHPDLHPNDPLAEARIREVNEAHTVLSNARLREEYDWERAAFLRGTSGAAHAQATQNRGSADHERRGYAPPTQMPVIACQRCGRSDTTLQISVFIHVYSFLIVTFRRPKDPMVLCSSCRHVVGWQTNLANFLLGIWGIPWGPMWVLREAARNGTGGYQVPEANAALLRDLAALRRANGDRQGADEAERAAQRGTDTGSMGNAYTYPWAREEAPVTGAEAGAKAQQNRESRPKRAPYTYPWAREEAPAATARPGAGSQSTSRAVRESDATEGRSPSWAAFAIAASAVVVIAAAAGAFFIGRSSADSGAARYQQGYTNGLSAGLAQGQSQGQSSGYATGYSAGVSKGSSSGYAKGIATGNANGSSTGYTKGYASGDASVFNGFTTPFIVGDFYLITVGADASGNKTIKTTTVPLTVGQCMTANLDGSFTTYTACQ